MRCIHLALGAFLVFSHTLRAETAANEENGPIKIGHVDSMTGSEATFGNNTKRGITLAIDQINGAGGIGGRKIEIITMDDQSKAEEAATAITKLIVQKKVVAVLGETTSSRTLAMAPIAQANKVPLVSPSATNPKVTEQGDFIFRVCFIDPFQGPVVARFAMDDLKAKRFAVLRDVKSDYSIGLADYFKDAVKKGGGEVIADQSYNSGDIDFRAQLTAIRTVKPDAIFVPGFYTEVGLIARQARSLGLKQPLLGGDGWDSPALTKIGGNALENSYFSNHYFPEATTPEVKAFLQKYKEPYGEVPDSSAALGYDAALILADALKRAKKTEPTAIKEALATTKNFQGVTGNITIDEHHNAVKPAVIVQIKKGQFKFHSNVAARM